MLHQLKESFSNTLVDKPFSCIKQWREGFGNSYFHRSIFGPLSANLSRHLYRGASMARSYSVTSSHTLFGYPVVNIRLSRSYTTQVKNAVALKEKNR
jgi:hypothetical protein